MRQQTTPEPDRSLSWIRNPSNWSHWGGYAVPLKKRNTLDRGELAVAVIMPDNTYKIRVGKTILEPAHPSDVWTPMKPERMIADGWLVD